MDEAPAPDEDLAALQAAGPERADRHARLGDLLEKHRARLLRMIQLRMDPALKARIGASDVLQEAYLEIANRFDDYFENPRLPFFVWVRFIASQRLLKLYRHHAGAKKRDVRREAKPALALAPQATSIVLADYLIASGITPSVVMAEGELRAQLVGALDDMNPLDREVLVLRHFEELSNSETAQALGIPLNTASKRYVRALERLGRTLKKTVEPEGG